MTGIGTESAGLLWQLFCAIIAGPFKILAYWFFVAILGLAMVAAALLVIYKFYGDDDIDYDDDDLDGDEDADNSE